MPELPRNWPSSPVEVIALEWSAKAFSKLKDVSKLISTSTSQNAAVRAVVKMGIARGCEVYVVREGWEGLVRGNSAPDPEVVVPNLPGAPTAHGERRKGGFVPTYGEGELLKEGEGEQTLKDRYIIRVGWDDVRGWASIGGTLIGTARCAEFRDIEGRRKAAFNLVKHGIDALVVCGGDGSLTGADKLRAEWPDHVSELLKSGKITPEQYLSNAHLNIVGLVGSIDNDMAGTDMTIGATSALHRICEAVDSISSTASSHSRAFVIEVMGRNCGWLALMAAIATGADYMFIPERPPSHEDWQTSMCEVLQRHRKEGKRKTIVIVAEGAQDCNLKPITPNEIMDVLTHRLGLDTRVTTLGHTQRGGAPAAYDRILATLQGAEAVEAVLNSTPDKPSPVIGIKENKITREPLMEAVKRTQAVATAIAAKDFAEAINLRDPEFEDCLHAFRATTRLNETYRVPVENRMRIGIIHTGAPAGGMNAATRTAVRYCLCHGHTPVAIYNGFVGLLEGNIAELSWLRVDQWTTRGGSELGTNRTLPDTDLAGVAAKLAEHKIDGLFIVGGFEGMVTLNILEQGRKEHKSLRIPLVHLPATISNNVPITHWSIGSDTSVNVLVEACDAIKQSASASRNRVFVVETQGAGCGYIAMLGALATGANLVYTPEVGITLRTLQKDVEFLKKRYQQDVPGKSEGRLVIRSEQASKTYTTEVVTNILAEEGQHAFDSRSVSLGHVLQGGIPSPRDRTRAIRLTVKCIDFLEKHFNRNLDGHDLDPVDPDVATIVIEGPGIRFASVKEMMAQADFKNRRGKEEWWSHMGDMVAVMSGLLKSLHCYSCRTMTSILRQKRKSTRLALESLSLSYCQITSQIRATSLPNLRSFSYTVGNDHDDLLDTSLTLYSSDGHDCLPLELAGQLSSLSVDSVTSEYFTPHAHLFVNLELLDLRCLWTTERMELLDKLPNTLRHLRVKPRPVHRQLAVADPTGSGHALAFISRHLQQYNYGSLKNLETLRLSRRCVERRTLAEELHERSPKVILSFDDDELEGELEGKPEGEERLSLDGKFNTAFWRFVEDAEEMNAKKN
ncbi:6-phosphofructokinase 1, partial [Phenoliferia sp. Uapishka_3]